MTGPGWLYGKAGARTVFAPAIATFPTQGGHTTEIQHLDDVTHAWCTSNCCSVRTFYPHLSTDPRSDATAWATAHAEHCTVTTPAGHRNPLDDLAAAVDDVRRTMRAVETATDAETRRHAADDFRAALNQLRDITGAAVTHLDTINNRS